MPRTLTLPQTSVYHNLKVSAEKYPEKTAVVYYGAEIPYKRLRDEVHALAGYLQEDLGVKKGDRVILYLQNCPQFVIAYYAILRADAVIVPVNPMNRTEELRHYFDDAQARVAIVGQEVYERVAPLSVEHLIVAAYADFLEQETNLPIPDFVRMPRRDAGGTAWRDAVDAGLQPGPHEAAPDDLAVMPYTSGTTGKPKGCM